MQHKIRLHHTALCILAVTCLSLLSSTNTALAKSDGKVQCPDFTQGDAIPTGWTHDWTLGPTGLRGWIYSDLLETSDARQILITEVEEGSPADGVLHVGDVILGAGQKLFDGDPRPLFGKAITQAEEDANQGNLRLLCWRKGKTGHVILKLPVMGSYSATAPFNCPKSQNILQQGWRAIAAKMESDSKNSNTITQALNASALLASGDAKYHPLLRKQAEIFSDYGQSAGGRTWQIAYVNIFLAEYVLATGDRSLIETGLQRITRKIVDGQSTVGSWGHGFAEGDPKRLGGYGMMNAPGIPLTYSLVLARRAGVEVSGLDAAIGKSTRLLRFYVGKGGIPYGDHHPWIQTHCDNGKNEMAAVLFDHQGDTEATQYFSRMAVASHGAERDTGHTGNFFNILWALPGVARSGPHASGAWMKEFGWHYDLARRWDGTFIHQGPPGQRHDKYRNWDTTGAYLLGYAQAQRKTYLTGRKPSAAPQINQATAEELINDGRGWSNKDRNGFYDALSTEQLMDRLSSWSPIVRERAATALARRQDDVVPQLIGRLKTPDLHTRYGACQALGQQRGRGVNAIPALIEAARADDLWLRSLAADALAKMGKPATAAAPEMLERLTQSNLQADPRNMEQRYLSYALFSERDGLLGRSLEGIDRDLLNNAVRAALLNDDGRARGTVGSVYKNLSYDELKPLLPAIHRAILEPAPSGIMFADGIQNSGLELYAKHHVSEGIELLADYVRTQKQHGSQKRIVKVMKILESYGAHAQRVIPQLEEAAHYFEHEEKDFPKKLSQDKARIVRESIKKIQATTNKPTLIFLK